MCLPFGVFEPIIERARAERLIEVRGATGSSASSYRYCLTDLGRDRARQYLEINQYVGPAPVPLAMYIARMRALAASRGYIDRERLRERLFASHHQRPDPRAARPGGERQQGAVPLRAARQRQDGDRRRSRPDDRRRDVHAARDRRRRLHHHDVRSDQPRAAGRGRRQIPPDRRVATRSPLGAHPPAGRHRRRRAHARHARPHVQSRRRSSTKRRCSSRRTAACCWSTTSAGSASGRRIC